MVESAARIGTVKAIGGDQRILPLRPRPIAKTDRATKAPEEVIAAVLTQVVLWATSLFHANDEEDGQGLAEYALILALIAIVAIVALIFLGSQISSKLSVIGDEL